MQFVMTRFADVESFLHDAHKSAPRLYAYMRDLRADINKKKLKMELAAVVDAGEPFGKATYVLEGDGLLVFRA